MRNIWLTRYCRHDLLFYMSTRGLWRAELLLWRKGCVLNGEMDKIYDGLKDALHRLPAAANVSCIHPPPPNRLFSEPPTCMQELFKSSNIIYYNINKISDICSYRSDWFEWPTEETDICWCPIHHSLALASSLRVVVVFRLYILASSISHYKYLLD